MPNDPKEFSDLLRQALAQEAKEIRDRPLLKPSDWVNVLRTCKEQADQEALSSAQSRGRTVLQWIREFLSKLSVQPFLTSAPAWAVAIVFVAVLVSFWAWQSQKEQPRRFARLNDRSAPLQNLPVVPPSRQPSPHPAAVGPSYSLSTHVASVPTTIPLQASAKPAGLATIEGPPAEMVQSLGRITGTPRSAGPQHRRRPIAGAWYTIQEGDTFSEIGEQTGVGGQLVAVANRGLNPRRLMPGTQIFIPTPNALVTSDAFRSSKIHVVKTGQTLEKIAKVNRTTVEQLRWLNRIEGDLIHPGQKLTIASR